MTTQGAWTDRELSAFLALEDEGPLSTIGVVAATGWYADNSEGAQAARVDLLSLLAKRAIKLEGPPVRWSVA